MTPPPLRPGWRWITEEELRALAPPIPWIRCVVLPMAAGFGLAFLTRCAT